MLIHQSVSSNRELRWEKQWNCSYVESDKFCYIGNDAHANETKTVESRKKFVSLFDFWVDELTHDQSCKVTMGLFHWRSGHRIFTRIEARAMRHSNTYRWNWGLIFGDVIWCCNYDLVLLMSQQKDFPKRIEVKNNTRKIKNGIFYCDHINYFFKYGYVFFASSIAFKLMAFVNAA